MFVTLTCSFLSTLILGTFMMTLNFEIMTFMTLAYLHHLCCPDLLELDRLHVLEGEAELLPVGQAGLEINHVNGHRARVPAHTTAIRTK